MSDIKYLSKDKINWRDQVVKPTYCAGCSFRCIASDCECICHDEMRRYYELVERRKLVCACGKRGTHTCNKLKFANSQQSVEEKKR